MMQRIDGGILTDWITTWFVVTACLIKGENLLRKQIACSLTPVNNCGFQHETSFLFLWISIAVACGLICIIAHLPSTKLMGTTPAPYQYLTHLSFLLNPSKWLTHYVGQRYINVLFFLNGPSELKKEKKERKKKRIKQCGNSVDHLCRNTNMIFRIKWRFVLLCRWIKMGWTRV